VASGDDKKPAGPARPTSRKSAPRDLTSSVPDSLTVSVELPVEVHTQPEDEAAVALHEVAITPSYDQLVPTTRSIDIVIDDVKQMPEEVEQPVTIPPLPIDEKREDRIFVPDDEPQAAVTRRGAETASMLTAERVIHPRRSRRLPPEGFWQYGLYRATLRLVNVGDSAEVRRRKAIDARIGKRLEGPTRFVAVLSRKGGVGKTTITTLLGMALAEVRDDRVIAIDANPDRGTLAERVNKQTLSTVRDIAALGPGIRGFSELSTHVSRDATRLDVLASGTDPNESEEFDAKDYDIVADVAARHYSIVLTDCGTGVVHSVMRATLQRADSIVVVSGGSVDEAQLASETLTWLESNNYGELAKNAIVALNTATQGTNLVNLDEIEAHFLSRVRDVVTIPYDPELAAGTVIRFDALQPFTRASARRLASLVMDGLPSRRDA
jgi:MinD-like ATPase involved in chromosome partitioning or flagellar assembly